MAIRIQLRRDTAAAWALNNPVLLAGEIGVESDTLKVKVGDGSTAWNALGYAIALPADVSAYVQAEVAAVIDSAPATLDTLNELAAALGDDPNFASTITSSLATKASASDLSSHASDTTNIHGIADTSALETTSGAQSKASAAQAAAEAAAASALSAHEADTTSIHGISNTANLVYTNDSRLTDTRTPTDDSVTTAKIVDSAVTSAKIADGTIVNDDINASAAIAPSKISGTAVVTNDSRLSDARTPTAHAASHGSAGSDALTLAQSQITNLTTDLAAKASASDLSSHESDSTNVHGIADTSLLATKSYADTAAATAAAGVVNSAPAALDTLSELATALGNDANFSTTTATALGNRVRVDAAQTFTAGEKTQARSNIDAVSTTDARLSDTRTPTDGSVTTAKIADSAVTAAKLAAGAAFPSQTVTYASTSWNMVADDLGGWPPRSAGDSVGFRRFNYVSGSRFSAEFASIIQSLIGKTATFTYRHIVTNVDTSVVYTITSMDPVPTDSNFWYGVGNYVSGDANTVYASSSSHRLISIQVSQSGNFLQTNGTTVSWAAIPTDTTRAPLASPALTGTPTAPTAAVDTNTTQVATTSFVVGQGYLKSATASSTYAPLGSPTFTGTVTLPAGVALGRPVLTSPLEVTTVSATAAATTVTFDAITQGVLYYTTNSSANWTLNIRGNSGTTLSSMLAVGQSITVAFLATNGATAYYQTGFQIDGAAVTPKWQGGTAPTSGNVNSIDSYTFTIIKTAATPTYTVLGQQTKFA